MNGVHVLQDLYGRLPELVHGAVSGLEQDQLNDRVDGHSNHIGWLIWHLTRVEDGHLADVGAGPELWTEGGWSRRFDLPVPEDATGWDADDDEVGAVRIADGAVLTGYFDAVQAQAMAYLAGLADADLDRIVDRNWDPPVTLGVRLVSVVDDCLEHVGQAAYVRGLLDRRSH